MSLNGSNRMISIVIPYYNNSDTIDEALSSISSSGFPSNTHVFIIDDGSSVPLSEDYTRMYPELNIHITYKANSGVSSARNLGLTIAESGWVTLLDADDILLPGYYREVNSLISSQVGLIHVNASYLFDDFCSITGSNPRLFRGLPSATRIRFINFIITSGVCINLDALRKSGLFSSSFKIAQDWDLWIRLSKVSNLVKVNKTLIGYRVNNTGLSSNRLLQLKEELDIILHEYMGSSKSESVLFFVAILFRLASFIQGNLLKFIK